MSQPLRHGVRAAVLAAAVVAAPLAATPASAADPAHDIVVDCSRYWRYNGVLAFAGYAYTPASHTAPDLLSVTCTYVNEVGRYTSTNTAAAPFVATGGSGLLAAGNMIVCSSAEAIYADGHVATVPETCLDL